MKGLKIRFVAVGRFRKTWEATLSGSGTPIQQIHQEVVRSGALMSRDIMVDANERGDGGVIYAGMRQVGTFEIIGIGDKALPC